MHFEVEAERTVPVRKYYVHEVVEAFSYRRNKWPYMENKIAGQNGWMRLMISPCYYVTLFADYYSVQ